MDIQTTAVIPMAGLSSRMGSFKPLMTINGFTLAELTVQSAIDAGASRICVVLGKNAAKVKAVLQNLPTTTDTKNPTSELIFAENTEFATTDMFCSVKLGLQALGQGAGAEVEQGDGSVLRPRTCCGAYRTHNRPRNKCGDGAGDPAKTVTFITPGDIAGVSPQTYGALRAAAANSKAQGFIPQINSHGGHPILLNYKAVKAVMDYQGSGGLKQAISSLSIKRVNVDDRGTLLDADTPECFARLEKLIVQSKGIHTDLTEQLFTDYQTPENVRQHCRATAALTRRMANQLNALGYCLDSQLCYSGALLHDICRVSDKHWLVGAAALRKHGYMALADIVAEHMSFEHQNLDGFDEALLVCLADKLVQETNLVTPTQRYQLAMQRFSADTEIGRDIRNNLQVCRQTLERYQQATGDILFSD